MAKNKKSQQSPTPPKDNGLMSPSSHVWNMIMIVMLVLMVVVGIYTEFSARSAYEISVPLSTVAHDISAGTITGVRVQGDQITATYADKTVKIAYHNA